MLNRVILNVGGDDKVHCEVINASQIILTFSEIVLPTYEDDEIIALRIGEGNLFLFDEIIVPIDTKVKSVYKVKKIERLKDEKVYKIYSSHKTKTNKFILPLISTKYTTRDYFLYDTFFENAYLGVDPSINLDIDSDYPLILLYRYSESEIYRSFESNVRKHPMFIKTFDINKSQVLFIFDIGEYAIDVELFKQGCYSQLSEEIKQKIMRFYDIRQGDTVHQILYKSPKLREQLEFEFGTSIKPASELYSKPNLAEEIYYE